MRYNSRPVTPGMESLASAFDQPLDSPAHRDLRESCWMGGELVSVRYWLGRLLNRNLFRESNEVLTAALQQYFLDRGRPAGARLISDPQTWRAVAVLLQHQVDVAAGAPLTKNPRLIAAIEAMMANPELSNYELAVLANTTEKQIARMTDVSVLRKVWREQKINPSHPTDQ